ncbi:MAG: ABC transporter permease [Proteobacteria bacterium]|jgi:ABC-2 type transport system permease protein|nr:ABC transporter permease [Pseudomonadota bacterium]
MTAVLRAVPDMAKVSFASLVAYRAEMTIWILTASFPLIMLALWNAVAGEGQVGGFGQDEFARYFTATLVVRQITSCWLVWVLNYEIRTGKLSAKLLKPIHPLWYHGVVTLCAIPFRLVILAPIVGVVVWWRPSLWAIPGAAEILLFVPCVLLAWLMNFLVQAIFATLSFWLDKTDGFFGMWFSCWIVFSGYIAPLALYPDWAQGLLRLLPFRGMLAVPVELAAGFLSPGDAVLDLGIQLIWVLFFLLLLRWLWRRGVVRYGAYGA